MVSVGCCQLWWFQRLLATHQVLILRLTWARQSSRTSSFFVGLGLLRVTFFSAKMTRQWKETRPLSSSSNSEGPRMNLVKSCKFSSPDLSLLRHLKYEFAAAFVMMTLWKRGLIVCHWSSQELPAWWTWRGLARSWVVAKTCFFAPLLRLRLAAFSLQQCIAPLGPDRRKVEYTHTQPKREREEKEMQKSLSL